MKDALAIHRSLLAGQTHHEIVRLPRAVADADELPTVLGLPPERCLVVRSYEADDHLVAVVVHAGEHPPPEVVRCLLGARRVRHAAADRVNAATDYAASLVAPLLLPDVMTILIDQRILDGQPDDHVVYAATGESRTAVGIHALDLLALTHAKPVDLRVPLPRRG